MKENEESKHEGMNMEKNNIPLLTIVRGFPGSGKTTFGRKLAAKQNGLFVEPDMFLYDRDGKYNYLPGDFLCAVHSAHDVLDAHFTAGGMFAVYADVLPTIKSVHSFVEKQRHMIPAILSDIDYKVVDMPKITYEEAKARNVHGVCEEDLKRMFEQWEDWK